MSISLRITGSWSFNCNHIRRALLIMPHFGVITSHYEQCHSVHTSVIQVSHCSPCHAYHRTEKASDMSAKQPSNQSSHGVYPQYRQMTHSQRKWSRRKERHRSNAAFRPALSLLGTVKCPILVTQPRCRTCAPPSRGRGTSAPEGSFSCYVFGTVPRRTSV